ncbi:MAG TPA: biotin synthase [Clostridia bacterium]|nr:biotin synthase [Clostridia bacterium]
MTGLIFKNEYSYSEKIQQMQNDAIYDIGFDSDTQNAGLKAANKILCTNKRMTSHKLFLSNNCVFNCAYCGCRCQKEKDYAYTFTPKELAKLAVEQAKIHKQGIFISSAIYKNADYTQELISKTLKIMRNDLGYKGFIHAKVMPGADPIVIHETGLYANRLSVNIEVAKSSGYEKIAKQKNKNNIINPMTEIYEQIQEHSKNNNIFATSQTTQLMAGSTNEDDRTIMRLSTALYKKFNLKRIYYTAFTYKEQAKGYEEEQLPIIRVPHWRMVRLYQADRLTQLYGFCFNDVTPESNPFLNEDIDPKAAWALRNMDIFPIEVNKVDFNTLIRVPGIGLVYAKKIIEARRYCKITHNMMRRMKIPMDKCSYFITCNGKFEKDRKVSEENIKSVLVSKHTQISIYDLLMQE